jgi:hypothetical protein
MRHAMPCLFLLELFFFCFLAARHAKRRLVFPVVACFMPLFLGDTDGAIFFLHLF